MSKNRNIIEGRILSFDKSPFNKDFDLFIDDIIQYKSCQVSGIFKLEKNKSSNFNYDIHRYFITF